MRAREQKGFLSLVVVVTVVSFCVVLAPRPESRRVAAGQPYTTHIDSGLSAASRDKLPTSQSENNQRVMYSPCVNMVKEN